MIDAADSRTPGNDEDNPPAILLSAAWVDSAGTARVYLTHAHHFTRFRFRTELTHG